jgi:hypothetical protein
MPSGPLCHAAILGGGGRVELKMSRAAPQGKARQPKKALITAGRFGDGTGSQQHSVNSPAGKGVPGTF